MAATVFMNSNSLRASVPDLASGSTDNKDAMLGCTLTYIMVYSTLGMVVHEIQRSNDSVG